MAQKPLAELDQETLHKQKLRFTGLLIMIGIAWLISLGLGVYRAYTQKTNFSLIAIAMSFIPIGMPLLVEFNKINAELKSRKSNL